MITPTVGRVCLYQKTHEDSWPEVEGLPYAALVCAVLPSGNVNLAVYDSEGHQHPKLDVSFTDEPTPGHPFWMDYQKGQAAKYEALEEQVEQVANGIALPSQAAAIRRTVNQKPAEASTSAVGKEAG